MSGELPDMPDWLAGLWAKYRAETITAEECRELLRRLNRLFDERQDFEEWLRGFIVMAVQARILDLEYREVAQATGERHAAKAGP